MADITLRSSRHTVSARSQGADLWARYADNWVRALGVVADQGDQHVRDHVEGLGYSGLRQAHIGPLTQIYRGETRASTLASNLSVSQAYMTKLLNQLERAGYLGRERDAHDQRSHRLRLSRQGSAMIEAALRELMVLHVAYSRHLGEGRAASLLSMLKKVGQLLCGEDERQPPGLRSRSLPVLMSSVSSLLQVAIWRGNVASGHEKLTATHWRVLHSVGLDGNTTTGMAEEHGLTTQAISRTARDLVTMGYVERHVDADDKRVSKLAYASRGLSLLTQTADGIEKVGDEVKRRLGAGNYQHFCRALDTLQQVGLETLLHEGAVDSSGLEVRLGQLKQAVEDCLVSVARGGKDMTSSPSPLTPEEYEVLTSIFVKALYR